MEHKTKKYLKYAIGEIFLVVIGILIALQINNWNENRKYRNQETVLLKSLKSEFENNLVMFDSIYQFHEDKENQLYEIINFDNQPISFRKLDTILEYITYNYTINLSTTIYRSSVNSGKIELIKNYQLKNRIAAFNDLLIDFQEEEIIAQEITNNQITPFINDNIVVRYPFGLRTEIELKKDKVEYRNLVRNVKFRNRITTLKGVYWDITSEGKSLREEIKNIIDDIKTELKE